MAVGRLRGGRLLPVAWALRHRCAVGGANIEPVLSGEARGGLPLVLITAVRWGCEGITRCVPLLGSRRGLYLAEPVYAGEGKKRDWPKQKLVVAHWEAYFCTAGGA